MGHDITRVTVAVDSVELRRRSGGRGMAPLARKRPCEALNGRVPITRIA